MAGQGSSGQGSSGQGSSRQPPVAAAAPSAPWWSNVDLDRDFRNAEDVATKVFGFPLEPEVQGDDTLRRKSIVRMTDIIVDRATGRLPAANANLELQELSDGLGCSPAYNRYKYEAGSLRVQSLAWVNVDKWAKAWKTHFKKLVEGCYDLDLLEIEIAYLVPGCLFRVETCHV